MAKRQSQRARWKSVERRVAEELSKVLGGTTERIPVNGRTGPDIKPFQRLVIDVKSRIEVPKSTRLAKGQFVRMGDIIGCRLEDAPILFDVEKQPMSEIEKLKTVVQWLSHMDEWVQRNKPEMVAVVVAHRPNTRVRTATLFIYEKERNKLW